MKIKNVYWIVIDSMRAYKGSGDSRYRIDYFDQLQNDFFNFSNAYTSAPSTVMSAASMFTGCETIKIARNYSDWKFNLDKIKPVMYYLNKLGFENIPIDNSKRAREMLADLIGRLDYKYFLKDTSHRLNWSNQQVLSIFKNSLETSKSEKKFIMTWYDCRGDKLINELIEEHIRSIKNYGNYENSIIIINSDHGYPDPKAIQTTNIIGKGHDLIVTEDNIKVPLLIKIPGIKPRTLTHRVSLVDILPTVASAINFKLENDVDGYSLFELLKNNKISEEDKDRFIRTDTRLLLQDGKITSLINSNCKYVKYHDSKIEELYDLDKDPNELKNVINDEKYNYQKSKLKKRFILHTKEIFDEQKLFLYKNVKRSFLDCNIDKYQNILFLSNLDVAYLKLITKYLKNKNEKLNFKIFRTKEFDKKFVDEFEISSISELQDFKLHNKSLIIVIDEKNYYRILDERFITYARKFKVDRLFLDFNFEKNNYFFSKWIFPLFKYKNNFYFYKREPILFLADLFKLTKTMINQYILKRKVQTPRGEDVKLQRDRFLKSEVESYNHIKLNQTTHHNFFYNMLINWGGTQKTIINLYKNLKSNQISTQIFTREISEELSKSYNLKSFNIKTFNRKIVIKKNSLFYISIFTNIFYFIFNLIKKNIKLFIRKSLSYIFNDTLTFNAFFSAQKFKRDIDLMLSGSKYFSSFLTKPNLMILFYYNYFCKNNQKYSIILNERNDITKQYLKKNKLLSYFYLKLLNKKKVTLLTNSIHTFDYFNKKKLKSEIKYIYNDINKIDESLYEFNKQFKTLRVSCIGRLTYQKGQNELIKMISKMESLENLQFNFIGRGTHSTKSQKILNKYKNKIFNKNSSDLNEIYGATDIVIINSHYEGQSNVIVESLEFGKLILTNIRLKKELERIYGNEILNFIIFFENQSDLNKILNLNYINGCYREKLSNQLKFAKNYTNKFNTLSSFYSKLQ